MPNESSVPPRDVAELLRAEEPSQASRWRRRLAVSAALVALLVIGLWWWWPTGSDGPRYQSEPLRKGDMTVTVTATGTLQPVNQVDVGSELSGTIEEVTVDFNDRVARGQVLARLNTDRLNAELIEARATLQSAQAKVQEAQATVLETRLRYKRCAKLAQRQLCSQEELDTATAAQARAVAAEASAKAQVAVAQATLDAHDTELKKALIRSPIDGIVLRRQIEPGQTVAASLQTPVLFSLAENLALMELHVSVDEADVGKVSEGQNAVFSVDAYPNRSFPASITQVRFAPQSAEGVVSYETVLGVDNSDLALRPGMTATAEITVQQRNDVLLVPNAALRFTPPSAEAKRPRRNLFESLFRRGPSSSNAPKRKTVAAKPDQRQVWVLRDGTPTAIPIRVGASDGSVSEVLSGDVSASTRVLTDVIAVRK